MSDRTTRKQVEAQLDTVARYLGRPREAWTKGADGRFTANIGALYLDHNTVYGGYVVEEIVSDGGGVRRPFGDHRMSASEAFYTLRAIADALRMAGVGQTVTA